MHRIICYSARVWILYTVCVVFVILEDDWIFCLVVYKNKFSRVKENPKKKVWIETKGNERSEIKGEKLGWSWVVKSLDSECLGEEGGSPRGFGKQGNIGKISKGTREHEPIFGNREQNFKKLQYENIFERVWEHWNIGQFWKGTREQGPPPPLGDPQEVETTVSSENVATWDEK